MSDSIVSQHALHDLNTDIGVEINFRIKRKKTHECLPVGSSGVLTCYSILIILSVFSTGAVIVNTPKSNLASIPSGSICL